ncbi:MAG: TlyA family RNA methyltransferase [Clostridia bacterium]|jgi:23S rRNA (cytidine1920-2'-O)/16S rRNA (cytidine1409-2'-O)-methyltransferase|nr:TlyA family RNA methyltransferase [Clostridia bacterium]MCI2000931.1 TlyA family RNA methyltransferase [Clostridia bacterium]MCI2015715.1 TlyA family RNA methyltransferase [Clostridia bacterium]
MTNKERLDILLFERKLVPSRERAKAIIMAGEVYVDGMKEYKAGTKIDRAAKIEVKGNEMKYVSRGGYKLEKAVNEFGLKLDGKICMDIGASTGGFTDCMLQNGAKKVYSVDVGYGQFAWKLRNDEKVVCLEKTNIRYITKDQVPDSVEFASVDVSFISLTKVIPPALKVMSDDAQMVCLIKPQFEAGREKVGKKGVVKDIKVHIEVIEKIIDFAFDIGLNILNIGFSPIKGPEGNIEYLIFLDRKNEGISNEQAYKLAEQTALTSHEIL